MSIEGTQWQLRHLASRPEYNGQHVTVVEKMDETTGRIRVRFDSSSVYIRVKPQNLVSRIDEKIDATTVAAAFSQLRNDTATKTDLNMSAFIERYSRGDFDGALHAAATWSLEEIKQVKAEWGTMPPVDAASGPTRADAHEVLKEKREARGRVVSNYEKVRNFDGRMKR